MAVREFIGVYHADAGIIGEAKYLAGHLLGRTRCSLCDITHSPVRRKKQWDVWSGSLGVPFQLYHRNEMPTEMVPVVAAVGSPLVVARTASVLVVLLDPGDLDRIDGSVEVFAQELESAVSRLPAGSWSRTGPRDR